MTTAKPNYTRQLGPFTFGEGLDGEQKVLLRTIINDNNFVDEIEKIALLFKDEYLTLSERPTLPETRATLKDLRVCTKQLAEKLDALPDAVGGMLSSFRMELEEMGLCLRSDGDSNGLNMLLRDLSDEIDKVLNDLPEGAKGRKIAAAERWAADMLHKCFDKYVLPFNANAWPDSSPSHAVQCLGLIFKFGGKQIERSSIEEYIKPKKGK